MNPSFDFIFGKPANEGQGRWVEGSVVADGCGYNFSAKLMLRRGSILSCQHVTLDVTRAYDAAEFVALLRLVSSGSFATATQVLGLYETEGLDPESAGQIFDAIAIWVDPWEHESLPLLEDLTTLGHKLAEARKREMMHLAFANFSAARNGRGVEEMD